MKAIYITDIETETDSSDSETANVGQALYGAGFDQVFICNYDEGFDGLFDNQQHDICVIIADIRRMTGSTPLRAAASNSENLPVIAIGAACKAEAAIIAGASSFVDWEKGANELAQAALEAGQAHAKAQRPDSSNTQDRLAPSGNM